MPVSDGRFYENYSDTAMGRLRERGDNVLLSLTAHSQPISWAFGAAALLFAMRIPEHDVVTNGLTAIVSAIECGIFRLIHDRMQHQNNLAAPPLNIANWVDATLVNEVRTLQYPSLDGTEVGEPVTSAAMFAPSEHAEEAFSETFLTLPTTRAFRTGGAPYKPGSGRAIATKYLTGDITLYPSQIISIEPMDRAFHLQDMMQDAVKLADGRDAVPIHPTSNDHADMTVLEDDLAQVYYIKANLSKLLPIVEQGVFDSRDRGLSSMEKLLLGNGTLLSKVDWESIPREQATGRFNEPAFSDLIY